MTTVPLTLTPREQEILWLLADGLKDREIAAELFVSPKTVEKHVASLRAKLGAPSRTAAVAIAVRSESANRGPEPVLLRGAEPRTAPNDGHAANLARP